MVLRLSRRFFYSDITRFGNVAVTLVTKIDDDTCHAITLAVTGNFSYFTFLAIKFTQC